MSGAIGNQRADVRFCRASPMRITLDSRPYDLSRPIDISVPLRFNGPQPNAYGVEPASSKACEYGSLIGDTRRGGSCNFEQYTFVPHCNGTHTECVGHITKKRLSVRDCLGDTLIHASLVSVQPVIPDETNENYVVEFGRNDRLITKSAIEAILDTMRPDNAGSVEPSYARALIVRTLPNDESKLTRLYDGSTIPPYFTTDAMRHIVETGFTHLLVDIPSIDRLFDEGKLSNHRIFWSVNEGSFEAGPSTMIEKTITELIYVYNEVEDGEYLLNLQIAPFESDCAPSRPVLFPPTG